MTGQSSPSPEEWVPLRLHREPGESVEVLVRESDREFFEREWSCAVLALLAGFAAGQETT